MFGFEQRVNRWHQLCRLAGLGNAAAGGVAAIHQRDTRPHAGAIKGKNGLGAHDKSASLRTAGCKGKTHDTR